VTAAPGWYAIFHRPVAHDGLQIEPVPVAVWQMWPPDRDQGDGACGIGMVVHNRYLVQASSLPYFDHYEYRPQYRPELVP